MKAVLIGDEYLRKHKKRDAAKLTYCTGMTTSITLVIISGGPGSIPGEVKVL
jgi:hypothetical protein